MSTGCCFVLLTIHREIVAGIDAAQMEESLTESKWESEEEYHPILNGAVSLE